MVEVKLVGWDTALYALVKDVVHRVHFDRGSRTLLVAAGSSRFNGIQVFFGGFVQVQCDGKIQLFESMSDRRHVFGVVIGWVVLGGLWCCCCGAGMLDRGFLQSWFEQRIYFKLVGWDTTLSALVKDVIHRVDFDSACRALVGATSGGDRKKRGNHVGVYFEKLATDPVTDKR